MSGERGSTKVERVIVGGGLAGGTAACLLAQAGHEVLLFERERLPADKICGEFLSEEAQRYLRRVGLDLDALGGERIEYLRLAHGEDMVRTRLPFGGLGVSRRALDAAVLDRAEACGAQVRRGVTARVASVAEDIVLDASGMGEVHTRTLFLATGKHDLKGLRREPPRMPEDLVGFKSYFDLAPTVTQDLRGHVELILFPQGYAGLQLVEGGRANLCLLVQRAYLQDCGNAWPTLLQELCRSVPRLRQQLAGAQPLLQRPLSIYRVPYGFVHAPSDEDLPGVYRLGDQAGVIPSFSGDGMAIALHTAAVAVRAHLGGASALDYHRQLRGDIRGQVARADLLYRIARSLPGRSILMQVARAWPQGLRIAAGLTRVSARAVTRELAA